MASVRDIERAHVGISASIDRIFKKDFDELLADVGKLYAGATVSAEPQHRDVLLKILIKHWVSIDLDPLKQSPQKKAKIKARQQKRAASKKPNMAGASYIAGMMGRPEED
jgi:hypothetical protein